MFVGPDQITICLKPRQLTRARTGGEDDVLGVKLFRALIGFATLTLPFAGKVASPMNDRNLVLLH